MAAFVGKAVRFAEMTLWLDEDRIIARALTWFPLVDFDGDGRRDLEKHQQEMNLVMREMASSSESHWSELYRAERFATFRWLPSQNILQELQESFPTILRKLQSHIRKENLSS